MWWFPGVRRLAPDNGPFAFRMGRMGVLGKDVIDRVIWGKFYRWTEERD
jgi:hypothetical protein